MVVEWLLEPAHGLVELAGLLDLAQDAPVVAFALDHGRERVDGEDQLVAGDFRREPQPGRRRNLPTPRLEAQRVHPGGCERGRRQRREGEPVEETDDDEGRQGDEGAQAAPQRRELRDAQIARHEQHGETCAEQQ